MQATEGKEISDILQHFVTAKHVMTWALVTYRSLRLLRMGLRAAVTPVPVSWNVAHF
jgi:hypothetical protein